MLIFCVLCCVKMEVLTNITEEPTASICQTENACNRLLQSIG